MNAKEVLNNVERLLAKGEKNYQIRNIYQDLGIFDWWKDYLSISNLKDMRTFLREAIKLGYTGYVCFKVGAKYTSNGMWAFKKESTTGYSPDGEALYKSFSPEYNYWNYRDNNNEWFPKYENYDNIKTIRELEASLEVLI